MYMYMVRQVHIDLYHFPTVSVQEYQAQNHEQWMEIELFLDVTLKIYSYMTARCWLMILTSVIRFYHIHLYMYAYFFFKYDVANV